MHRNHQGQSLATHKSVYVVYGVTNHALLFILQTTCTAALMLKLLDVLHPLVAFRSRGGLDAERAERIKCKQEDMDRDQRNFEAMQVRLHTQHPPTMIITSLEPLPLLTAHSCTDCHSQHCFRETLCAQCCASLSLSMIRTQPKDLLYDLQSCIYDKNCSAHVCTCVCQA